MVYRIIIEVDHMYQAEKIKKYVKQQFGEPNFEDGYPTDIEELDMAAARIFDEENRDLYDDD